MSVEQEVGSQLRMKTQMDSHQAEITRLQGEIEPLKREKQEIIQAKNEDIKGLQDQIQDLSQLLSTEKTPGNVKDDPFQSLE
jgi:chromosome segregation ATPase